MKKSWVIGGVALAAIGLCAFQQGGKDLLTKHAAALSSADGLAVTYSVTALGGAPNTITMNLGRPNMAMIDDSKQLVVADGSTITFLDKSTNSYFKRTQTSEEFMALFSGEGMSLWSSFFNKDQFSKLAGAKFTGTKTRKGVEYRVVQVASTDGSGVTWTYYLHPADGIARQAEIAIKGAQSTSTTLLDTKSLSLGKQDEKLFAFQAPKDAKEISEAELYADRWYYDLDEAKKVASATKRMIFLDFFTEW